MILARASSRFCDSGVIYSQAGRFCHKRERTAAAALLPDWMAELMVP